MQPWPPPDHSFYVLMSLKGPRKDNSSEDQANELQEEPGNIGRLFRDCLWVEVPGKAW